MPRKKPTPDADTIRRKIIEKLVSHALECGYALSVDNGGSDWAVQRSQDPQELVEGLLSNPAGALAYYHDRGALAASSWVCLERGVIADYSRELADHLIPVMAYTETLRREAGL